MAKRLPVPPELEHLIEKREEEADRRRSDADRRGEDDLGPLGAIESAEKFADVPTDERRGDQQRRKEKDRRGDARREENA